MWIFKASCRYLCVVYIHVFFRANVWIRGKKLIVYFLLGENKGRKYKYWIWLCIGESSRKWRKICFIDIISRYLGGDEGNVNTFVHQWMDQWIILIWDLISLWIIQKHDISSEDFRIEIQSANYSFQWELLETNKNTFLK